MRLSQSNDGRGVSGFAAVKTGAGRSSGGSDSSGGGGAQRRSGRVRRLGRSFGFFRSSPHRLGGDGRLERRLFQLRRGRDAERALQFQKPRLERFQAAGEVVEPVFEELLAPLRLESFAQGPDRQGQKKQTQTPKGRDEL